MNTFNFKYFDNVLTHADDVLKLKAGQMCPPRFATLHLTYRCNHYCMGCSYAGKLDGYTMPWSSAATVICNLIEIGVNAFEFCGGGEPSLLPYLPSALRLINEYGKYFGMLTNGSNLTDELIDLFARHGTYLRVSIEASDRDTYTAYVRKPADEWVRVQRNMHKLLEKKRKLNSKLDVGLKFGVGKSLRGEQHYLNGIRLGAAMGVSNVQFKALRHEPEELSQAELEEEAAILASVIPEARVPVIASVLPSQYAVPQCWLNPLHAVVDAHGDVYACCYYYYRPAEMTLGNMLSRPFRELWFSEDHWRVIHGIKREHCAQVDCKFFKHHAIVDAAFANGRHAFL